MALLLTSAGSGAPLTLSGTELRELPVSANGRSYLLYIAFPPSYDTEPNRRYPVVYHLDAYWDFTLMSVCHGNLRVDLAAPEALIVGIGYGGANPDVNRLRALDYTPGSDPRMDPTGLTTGRAEAFLEVIANEIIPLVERDYRGDPSFRVLAGNSFGGLFTVYAALERPGLFNACIASSPSLWWRNYALQAREAERAQTATPLPVRLYLAYATGDHASIRGSTAAFYRQIRARNRPELAVALREVEGERHSSLKPETYTRGLRFAFAPIAPAASLAGTTDAPRLINVSTRGRVGVGDDRLIAGFVVSGFNPKRVLVRAAGPALGPLGVADWLRDPQVTVHDATGAPVATNDNWSGRALTDAAAAAGAFAFAAGSLDAGLILTLEPGAYTAVVSGTGATTGNALVEVYELP